MSTPTSGAVAIETVSHYSLAGKHLVAAYRLGARRLVDQINGRYKGTVSERALPLVGDAVKASLLDAQRLWAGWIDSGIATASDRADQGLDWLAVGATKGIKRIDETRARIEAAFNTSAVQSVGKLGLPAAQMSLTIAEKISDGAKRLADRMGASDETPLVAGPAVKSRAKRRARKA